ncbi:MAG: hypothetical protein IPM92_02730 [Saprospiraceae bacterium]|nr:hypothetical protein [Saprospiraceae bacterium]
MISHFQTVYSDDLRDWRFLDEEESQMGSLRARWGFEQDFSQWDIRIDELSGSIQQRWKNQPHDWEIRLLDHFLTATPVWAGQFDVWRIAFKDKIYNLRIEPESDGIQCLMTQGEEEVFIIYNSYFFDYRDWSIEYLQDVEDQILVVTGFFLAGLYGSKFPLK